MKSDNTYIYNPKSSLEKERLEERDKRTSQRRSFALNNIDLSDTRKILDVGCGNGLVGFDILSRTQSASLTGVDIEPEILLDAINKSPSGYTSYFSAGDGTALPLVASFFDLVTCQYVLQHVNEPVQILKEMRRVCRKNAKIIVFEWDDGVNFSHPPIPEELDKVFQAKIQLVHQKGGDRYIGRKLYHLLSSAGWINIDIKLVHDIWQGPEDRAKYLQGTKLSLKEIRPQLIENHLITEIEFDLAMQQLIDYYSGDIFSVAVFFAGYAINPG